MTISKRTLTKWRRDALKTRDHLGNIKSLDFEAKVYSPAVVLSLIEQILAMTRELLDQELIKH